MRSIFAIVVLASLALASAQVTFDSTTATKHKTTKYRDPSGKPQTKYTILRRNADFTVTVKGATATTTYSFETLNGKESIPLKVVSGGASATLKHEQGAIGLFNFVAKNGATKLASAPVVVLANPYASGDECFIPSKSTDLFPPELIEHVENEKGALWQGSSKSNNWIPWAYNQYDLSVLETVSELIEPLTIKQRASTALVTRFLTTQSGKVLRGRWDGSYSDGKQPGFWGSSTQIIGQYRQTKSVVKYGQCWVFAGLLTSLCRSIGIPSRPLTNFDSAHEHAPFDQQCHTKYKKTASGYERESADNSIWNFHVWVDAWMTRPDLAGKNADGWQAIDATPQEQSSGPNESPFSNLDYRCGPAPHSLIKAMDVKQPFDVAFVAGEANCLKVDYVDGVEVSRDANLVGELILTKSPDSKCNGVRMDSNGYDTVCRSNLARSYSKQGSFLQVAQMVRNARFKVDAPDSVRLGKGFEISIKPAAGFRGEADYSIVLSAVSYNSEKVFGVLKSVRGIGAQGASITVKPSDWNQDWLKQFVPSKTATFDVLLVAKPRTEAMGAARAKGSVFLKHLMIPVQLPRLAMLCGRKQRSFKKDQVIACNVQFFNPLPYAITNAKMSFSISGQGSQSEQTLQIQSAIAPDPQAQAQNQFSGSAPGAAGGNGSQLTATQEVDPNSRTTFKARFPLNGATGSQLIVAKLSSNELDGVSGLMEITILP